MTIWGLARVEHTNAGNRKQKAEPPQQLDPVGDFETVRRALSFTVEKPKNLG